MKPSHAVWVAAALCGGAAHIQAQQTKLDLRTQTRNVDFSAADPTRPMRTGTVIPPACSVGDLFFKTDAAPGQNLYGCTATNTWTPQAGGGGGASSGASYVTLGADSTLPNERILTPGQGVSIVDGGANNNVTLSADTAILLSRATHQAGTDLFCADLGSTAAYTCSLTPALTAYTAGMAIVFSPNTTNTGAATININGLGAKPITQSDGASQPASGALASGGLYTLYYDGTSFRMHQGGGSGGGITAVGNCSSGSCFQSVAANQVLASPGAGGSGQISARALVASDLPAAGRLRTFGVTIDGGSSAITTGLKGYTRVPFACTITKHTLLADQTGSITIDIWKDSYANYPPTAADTITGSAKPALFGTNKAESTTLTGWTTSVAAGDTIGFNVDSAATVTRVHLILECQL